MIPPAGGRWRADIQAVRGLAVCMVILFHSGLGIAPSGYLGVDIFFVVSGFLITGIVMRGRIAGTFRLRDFYLRRVRRLFPAAATVLAVTTLTAIFVLSSSGYARFWPQLVGALTFSTNVVLWRQINYFNNLAAFEPLLHMWSLAVEEQYYLLLPFALMLAPPRLWPAGIAVVTVASVLGYTWLYPHSPGAAFYLLPTRAWEIGLGSLAACIPLDHPVRKWLRWGVPPAAVILIAMSFVAPRGVRADLLAVPACLAAFTIVAAPPPGMQVAHALRPATWVGDRSYALYLVHWPFFAFANTIYLGDRLPTTVSVALIVATFALAALLYAWVEEPVRRAPVAANRLWTMAIAGSLAIALLGWAGLAAKRASAPAVDLRGVTGLHVPGCNPDATDFDGRCTQSPSPQILVWGDSFSQHLIPALVATTARPIVQASKGGCAPLLGLAPLDLQSGMDDARRCLARNDSVLTYLKRTPSVQVVVLSGRYLRYGFPDTGALLDMGGGEVLLPSADVATLVTAQRRTTAAVRALGKRIILIGGPPQARFDAGQCWERRLRGLPSVTSAPHCAITAANMHRLEPYSARLTRAFHEAGIPVVTLGPTLCHAGVCDTAWGGVPLYRDGGHLSAAGSVLIGRRLALGERVWRDAR